MGRKKVDIKIRLLIEQCVASNQRSLFCVLGKNARDQVVLFQHMLCKARDQVHLEKPTVLWCFKKNNGYTFICQKKQRLLKRKYAGNHSVSEEDSFDHFLASSNITFCHYNDTTSILGQTFGMLVIQDFEATTPNILSRIIECIEGRGVIILFSSTTQNLEEIASLRMEAHSRYITSAHPNIDPVFNTRFVLSLADCENCMILDDRLRILLCQSRSDATAYPNSLVKKKPVVLQSEETDSNDILNRVASLCCTIDQAKAVKTFISTLKEKCTNSVVSLTSARGRGKSAALGLSISCALYLKYSNIYVTSPQIENLQTLFSFIIKGMNTFEYKDGKDYNISYCYVENEKLITGMNVFHDHKQVIKYLNPTEFPKVGISDLVVIDEAAAIPLPVVKNWMKSNMIFMASTINGYEGTGRSLSLKFLSQLRELSQQNIQLRDKGHLSTYEKNFVLKEIELNEAIRYADGDSVERWLNNLFCLNSEVTYLNGEAPDPETCQLYYVNRKTLFSYQNVAEKFLQQLVALFVSSHYKNSPNDLLMMADAPSHHIFCLLPPVNKQARCLPNVLCVIQVALEGRISKDCVIQELSHGKRASGDMIPWIISQQFQDDNFPMLSGARIVRIATHPYYQRMGYGQRALQLLFTYYAESSKTSLQCTDMKDEKSVLLLNLNELEPEKLDYIGVSYGLTSELLRFWKKLDFLPLYVRQTASETTGEHSCIMVKTFKASPWLPEYFSDFIHRFTTLLTSAFRNLPAVLALEMLHYYKRNHFQEVTDSITTVYIQSVLTECSVKRLKAYCNHLVDYHLIMDLMPVLARAYFLNFFKFYYLSSIQETILLCMGLQSKSVEETALELNMETNQVMGLFMNIIKKIPHHLVNLQENSKQNKCLQDLGHGGEETKNSSMKDQSFKRKQEDPSHGQRKKQSHHKTPS